MIPITRKDIMTTKLLTNKAKLWAYSNIEYLNTPMRILGTSTKVEKGNAHGVPDKRDTYIVYMQPADKVALDTICAMAVAGGCKAPCLKSSGQLGIAEGNADKAATKRTIWYLMRYDYFVLQLKADIDKAERKAVKTGIPALFRLNGTSDIDFSDIIAERPRSQFYDYTKILSRVRKNTLDNYDLTFSASMYSVQSKAALKKAVQSRYKIAVAYNTKGLQSDNIQVPNDAVSFDTTDLRPLDASGTIGVLKRKGSNKVQRASEGYQSFFVTADNVTEFNNIIARG